MSEFIAKKYNKYSYYYSWSFYRPEFIEIIIMLDSIWQNLNSYQNYNWKIGYKCNLKLLFSN
jgi:hypothetical protein